MLNYQPIKLRLRLLRSKIKWGVFNDEIVRILAGASLVLCLGGAALIGISAAYEIFPASSTITLMQGPQEYARAAEQKKKHNVEREAFSLKASQKISPYTK